MGHQKRNHEYTTSYGRLSINYLFFISGHKKGPRLFSSIEEYLTTNRHSAPSHRLVYGASGRNNVYVVTHFALRHVIGHTVYCLYGLDRPARYAVTYLYAKNVTEGLSYSAATYAIR